MDDIRPALQNAGVKPFQSHILVVLWCDEVYPAFQTQAKQSRRQQNPHSFNTSISLYPQWMSRLLSPKFKDSVLENGSFVIIWPKDNIVNFSESEQLTGVDKNLRLPSDVKLNQSLNADSI